MKYIVIIVWIYYLVYILSNIKEIRKKLWYIVLYGETVVSATIGYLISRWKLALVDFSMFQIVVTRCSSVYLVVRLIGDKTPGFDTVDTKMLQDAVFLSAFPLLLIATTNWKI